MAAFDGERRVGAIGVSGLPGEVDEQLAPRRDRKRGPRDQMTALVGLDVGTTGVKALALSPDGEVLARAEEEYPLSTPQPGWAEQDPEDWWRATEAALDALGRRTTSPGSASRARCTASSSLDADERVLRPAILWNDQRTAAECAEIEERVGARTGSSS